MMIPKRRTEQQLIIKGPQPALVHLCLGKIKPPNPNLLIQGTGGYITFLRSKDDEPPVAATK